MSLAFIRNLKFITVVCFLFIPVLVLSGQMEDAGVLPDTITKITIASEPDYPPHCFVDKDGNAAGFAVEIFLAAADAAGLEVEIKTGVWSKIKNDLAEGRIDALPFVGRTPEREQLFDFTFSYMSLHGAVFIHRRTKDIKSLDDLKDKEVVVMKGDNAEEFVRRYEVSEKIFTTNTYEEAFKRLANREYDALITQRVTGITLVDELGLRNIYPLEFYLPRFRQDFCFAVKEGNDQLLSRLNEGLSIIIANDRYDEIRLKWFGPVEKEVVSVRDVIRIGMFILLPLIFISAVLLTVILRREIRRRTAKLNKEIEEHKRTTEVLRRQNLFLIEMEKLSKTGSWERLPGLHESKWTSGTYEIYGVSPESFDPSDYEKVMSFYEGKDREILDKAVKKLLQTGDPYSLELKLNSDDGEQKWVATRGMAEMRGGRVSRIFGNIIDITESKHINRQLKELTAALEQKVSERTAELQEKIEKLDKSQKAMLYMVEDLNNVTSDLKKERAKLEASNRELEAFSYSVSHDLRAPLRSINGFSTFLLEDYYDKLDDEGKRLLSVIQKNAKKMDGLINDMLRLSRVARTDLHKADVDMYSLVKGVYNEVATDEEKEEFELIINDLPKAECDPSLIKQVWQNLIGNALKYSAKSDKKRIVIGSDKKNDETEYYVKDHGAGFDPKYVDKLYGVFKRLHREDEFEGTGVGLAIVQRVILRHGGAVSASGKINGGATFAFTLPVE
ncbi:MAG: transporter substrate-binding domain-containing protein [Bacteroidales bacterium]|nr:transporter substrate-binding domain-containing protein [Bacteroidales bacterium]